MVTEVGANDGKSFAGSFDMIHKWDTWHLEPINDRGSDRLTVVFTIQIDSEKAVQSSSSVLAIFRQ